MRAKLAGAFVKSILGAAAEHALHEGSAALAARLSDPDALLRFREAVAQRLAAKQAQHPPAAAPQGENTTPDTERHAGRLSRTESMALLNLAEPFTGDDVKRAHREAMLRNHPDRGGSTYLMQLINLARDSLLASEG